MDTINDQRAKARGGSVHVLKITKADGSGVHGAPLVIGRRSPDDGDVNTSRSTRHLHCMGLTDDRPGYKHKGAFDARAAHLDRVMLQVLDTHWVFRRTRVLACEKKK